MPYMPPGTLGRSWAMEESKLSEQEIAHNHLSFRDVIRVLRLVDETRFQEMQLEIDGLKVRVVQDQERSARPAAAPVLEPAAAPAPEPVVAAAVPVIGAVNGEATGKGADAEIDGNPVLAPLAGTFYRAPSPGAPPFVEVGAVVKQGQVVGILEIMKLMNHVTAPCAGVISRICARNEEFVEYGQVLAVIQPGRVK